MKKIILIALILVSITYAAQAQPGKDDEGIPHLGQGATQGHHLRLLGRGHHTASRGRTVPGAHRHCGHPCAVARRAANPLHVDVRRARHLHRQHRQLCQPAGRVL